MLIIDIYVASMYIKVYALMKRGLVSEAESVDSFVMSCKIKHFFCLVSKIVNLLAGRPFYLLNVDIVAI